MPEAAARLRADGRAVPRDASVAAGRSRAGVWLQAARVKSLAISSIAVFAGGAVAFHEGYVSWRLLLAWLGSVAIQAGTNLINVSYNYKTGSGSRRFAADPRGSSAVVQLGMLSADQVRRGALRCFAVGAAIGITLVALCGWPILAIGLPAIAAGYSYGAPPLRLAYRGLGVLTVLLFMGPIMVAGAHYVVALRFSAAALLASLPIGLLAAAVMHTNDLRDFESDVAHGKRTLSTRLGRDMASHVELALVAAAYAITVAAVLAATLPWTALAVLITVPRATGQVRMVYRERAAPALNEAWFRAVQLHSQFGALLIVALIAAGALGL
jgi:1,4-dihydroxy-2-naphthoate octaprenyltransferase